MLFYKHTGIVNGAATWPITAPEFGNGWDFRQVFAGSSGSVYAIRQNGDMLYYKYTGTSNGAAALGPSPASRSAAAGISARYSRQIAWCFAIKQDGDMLYYKHAAQRSGQSAGRSGQEDGNGWDFRQVFASSNGSIYAIKQNGDMLYYKHAGYNDGAINSPFRPRRSATVGISARSSQARTVPSMPSSKTATCSFTGTPGCD